MIIFDFDGTLAHTRDCVQHLFMEAAERFGIRWSPEERVADFQHLSARQFIQLLISRGLSPLKVMSFYRHMKNKMLPHSGNILLFPGIPELIRALYQQKIDLVILSSNSQDLIGKVLSHHNVAHFFSHIYAVNGLFGKAKALKKLIRTHSLNKVLLVGDEVRDIEAGKSVNIPVISVSWGFNNQRSLEAAGPHGCVQTVGELEKAISLFFNVL